jgi:exonuclease III
MFLEVKENSLDERWILGVIYGDTHKTINCYIWERIELYGLMSGKPVCVIGDFNVISKLDDKWGDSRVMSRYMREFTSMISRGGFIDLGYNGPMYTWTNRSRSLSHLILERPDRSYATVPWMVQFPNAKVYHLPRFNSDHTPILLLLNSSGP